MKVTQQELSDRRQGLRRAIYYLTKKGFPFKAENHKIINSRFEQLTGLKNPGLKFRVWVGQLYSTGCEFLKESAPRKPKKSKQTKAGKIKPGQKDWDEYNKYLLSPEWRLFRQKAFKHYGKICIKCGSKKYLQVHHLHYKNLFHEKLEDVLILCEPCHMKVHNRKSKFET